MAAPPAPARDPAAEAALRQGIDLLQLGRAGEAETSLRMAYAMKYACWAGRYSYQSGRIPKKLYATASSPDTGVVMPRP